MECRPRPGQYREQRFCQALRTEPAESRHAVPTWTGLDVIGIISPTEAANFYVWDSEEAAKAFFTDQLLERVAGLYGVRPSVEFVEIATLVENNRAWRGPGRLTPSSSMRKTRYRWLRPPWRAG